jgi:hypothetical protein
MQESSFTFGGISGKKEIEGCLIKKSALICRLCSRLRKLYPSSERLIPSTSEHWLLNGFGVPFSRFGNSLYELFLVAGMMF